MSMTAEQRRTEVLHEDWGRWGKLRIVKASSRYDRRYRYLVVEWCAPINIGTAHEEYSYQVLHGWHPAGAKESMVEARAFFAGFRMALVTLGLPGT